MWRGPEGRGLEKFIILFRQVPNSEAIKPGNFAIEHFKLKYTKSGDCQASPSARQEGDCARFKVWKAIKD